MKRPIFSHLRMPTTIGNLRWSFLALFFVILCFGYGCVAKNIQPEYAFKGVSESYYEPLRPVASVTAPADDKPKLPGDRKLYYNGYIKFRATDPDEILNRVVAIAESTGGYTENRASLVVTVRVPVSKFDAIFKEMLALGVVIHKSVTVKDITEEYTDIELRLSLARETQKRLTELLAKAETEEEKLQLLKEIRRVNEEIEYFVTLVEMLKSLADYSRLTIEVELRQALEANTLTDDIAEFRWIHSLSPFRRDVSASGKVLEFNVPKGMVALDKKGQWIAESADGTVFWSCALANKPRGDTDFWFDAVKFRLAPEFESSEREKAGKFRMLRLADRAKDSYVYLAGVRADDDRLELVEVYYPSAAHEKRYGKEILESIAKGEK